MFSKSQGNVTELEYKRVSDEGFIFKCSFDKVKGYQWYIFQTLKVLSIKSLKIIIWVINSKNIKIVYDIIPINL